MTRAKPLLALLFAGALAACGQTGPLFLPPPDAEPVGDGATENNEDERDDTDATPD